MKHLISEYFAYRKEKQFQITFRKIINIKIIILNSGWEMANLKVVFDYLDKNIEQLVQSKITNNDKSRQSNRNSKEI